MSRFIPYVVAVVAAISPNAMAARLSMELNENAPENAFRIDIIWTMNPSDNANWDLDGFDAFFEVEYPVGSTGQFVVTEVTTLPGWRTDATYGVGGPFTVTDFFLSTLDLSYEGISGNGTTFSTIIASIFLEPYGSVAGTEVVFRHRSYQDLVPAPYDGPLDWRLRWQYEVTGPFQFDIGVGNPGDLGGAWTYHGYETYQPLIIPEPGSFAMLALAGVALCAHQSRVVARRG